MNAKKVEFRCCRAGFLKWISNVAERFRKWLVRIFPEHSYEVSEFTVKYYFESNFFQKFRNSCQELVPSFPSLLLGKNIPLFMITKHKCHQPWFQIGRNFRNSQNHPFCGKLPCRTILCRCTSCRDQFHTSLKLVDFFSRLHKSFPAPNFYMIRRQSSQTGVKLLSFNHIKSHKTDCSSKKFWLQTQ